MKKNPLAERMLDAYLGLSSVLWNRRIPSALSFNEAVVCHYLAQAAERHIVPVTATWLCEKTQIAKSQMNRIITKLESRGLVRRIRSQEDRREILLCLDDANQLFQTEHDRIVALTAKMQEHFGLENSKNLTFLVEKFVQMLQETNLLEQQERNEQIDN